MNERERRFCEEYLIDLNAVNAALYLVCSVNQGVSE